jgi:hypothetical protein
MLLAAIVWQVGGLRAERIVQEPNSAEQASEFAEGLTSGGSNWQEELIRLGIISTSTENAVDPGTTTTHIADVFSEELIRGYAYLKEAGAYSPESGAQYAQSIGSSIRIPLQFVSHTENALTKSADTSVERMLVYRTDMQKALEMFLISHPPEFETFGYYIETGDKEKLDELAEAAERYRDAERATLAVVVPMDAISIHLRVVNALGGYASALEQLIRYADDALSTLTVLRTYNEAEREMLEAFDALADYYVKKSTQ